MTKKSKRWLFFAGGLAVGLGVAGFLARSWYIDGLKPMPMAEEFLIRYDRGSTFYGAVADLTERGVIRNERVFLLYCRLQKKGSPPSSGTYRFHPGMTTAEILEAINAPLVQMVRIPEGWWIARVAEVFEKNGVCTAEEYIEAANDPARFEDEVRFKLPQDSLEGYLYPDTYDFPPMLGAENAIRMQLSAFEIKVIERMAESSLAAGGSFMPADNDVTEIITKASLIELEAAVEKDRPLIAGVIENRLKKNMKLQLDATVMYALQKWRKLEAGEVNRVESPYNTYRNPGLPPGPIGSPAWRSIRAAMRPAEHKFYYYYAPPGSMEHIFTKSYEEHKRAIRNPERFMPPAEVAQP